MTAALWSPTFRIIAFRKRLFGLGMLLSGLNYNDLEISLVDYRDINNITYVSASGR